MEKSIRALRVQVFMEKSGFEFFGNAFAALVLLPTGLFVVFLLVLAYKFKWIQPQFAALYFVLFLAGFGVIFLIIRKNAIRAVAGVKIPKKP